MEGGGDTGIELSLIRISNKFKICCKVLPDTSVGGIFYGGSNILLIPMPPPLQKYNGLALRR